MSITARLNLTSRLLLSAALISLVATLWRATAIHPAFTGVLHQIEAMPLRVLFGSTMLLAYALPTAAVALTFEPKTPRIAIVTFLVAIPLFGIATFTVIPLFGAAYVAALVTVRDPRRLPVLLPALLIIACETLNRLVAAWLLTQPAIDYPVDLPLGAMMDPYIVLRATLHGFFAGLLGAVGLAITTALARGDESPTLALVP